MSPPYSIPLVHRFPANTVKLLITMLTLLASPVETQPPLVAITAFSSCTLLPALPSLTQPGDVARLLILPKRCKNRAESVRSCHHSHASVLLARLLLSRLSSAVTALHVALRPLETRFANCVPHGDFFCFFVPLPPAIFARVLSSIYALSRR